MMNILFSVAVPQISTLTRTASILLLIGAVTMPATCFLSGCLSASVFYPGSSTGMVSKSDHAAGALLTRRAIQSNAMRRILIQLIVLYRATLGQFLGGQCRFHPTCSQYAIDAISKYGATRGGWRAIKRIARCHPWGGEGYDPA